MSVRHQGIVVGVRPLGEHDALVRLLTPGAVVALFVHGARGRRARALLWPGGSVAAEARPGARGLAAARLEPLVARPHALADPLAADALQWLTALADTALADGAVPVALHDQLVAVLDALGQQHAWPAGAARFELELLRAMGFGPDWSGCALGGPADELAWASPRTGRAVSRARALGQPWAARLLPLPAFLTGAAPERPTAAELTSGLRLTGHLLSHHLALPAARARALARLGLAQQGLEPAAPGASQPPA